MVNKFLRFWLLLCAVARVHCAISSSTTVATNPTTTAKFERTTTSQPRIETSSTQSTTARFERTTTSQPRTETSSTQSTTARFERTTTRQPRTETSSTQSTTARFERTTTTTRQPRTETSSTQSTTTYRPRAVSTTPGYTNNDVHEIARQLKERLRHTELEYDNYTHAVGSKGDALKVRFELAQTLVDDLEHSASVKYYDCAVELLRSLANRTVEKLALNVSHSVNMLCLDRALTATAGALEIEKKAQLVADLLINSTGHHQLSHLDRFFLDKLTENVKSIGDQVEKVNNTDSGCLDRVYQLQVTISRVTRHLEQVINGIGPKRYCTLVGSAIAEHLRHVNQLSAQNLASQVAESGKLCDASLVPELDANRWLTQFSDMLI